MAKQQPGDLSQKSLYPRIPRPREMPNIPKGDDQEVPNGHKGPRQRDLDENHPGLSLMPVMERHRFQWQDLPPEAPWHLTEANLGLSHIVDPTASQLHPLWLAQMCKVVCHNPNLHEDTIFRLRSCKMSLSSVNQVSPKVVASSPELRTSKQGQMRRVTRDPAQLAAFLDGPIRYLEGSEIMRRQRKKN